MRKRHVAELTDDRRADLEGRYCGRLAVRERNRVQVLLRSARGDTDEEIADAPGVCVATAAAARKRFVAAGLDAALTERPRSGGPAKFDGKVEAAVVAAARSPVPDGRAERTVSRIAGRLAELGVVESMRRWRTCSSCTPSRSAPGGRG
jgi:transposase